MIKVVFYVQTSATVFNAISNGRNPNEDRRLLTAELEADGYEVYQEINTRVPGHIEWYVLLEDEGEHAIFKLKYL